MWASLIREESHKNVFVVISYPLRIISGIYLKFSLFHLVFPKKLQDSSILQMKNSRVRKFKLLTHSVEWQKRLSRLGERAVPVLGGWCSWPTFLELVQMAPLLRTLLFKAFPWHCLPFLLSSLFHAYNMYWWHLVHLVKVNTHIENKQVMRVHLDMFSQSGCTRSRASSSSSLPEVPHPPRLTFVSKYCQR
jgi:hypothetical protein